MPSMTFVDKVTPVPADWLNEVNNFVFTLATPVRTTYTGDGTTRVFALPTSPGLQSNLEVMLDGLVLEQNIDYFWSVLNPLQVTLYVAPPNLSTLVIKSSASYPVATPTTTDASLVTYQNPGAGSVQTTVDSKLRESVSVKDFGAVGDGVTNDWQACQEACDYIQSLGGGTVIFPAGGTYRLAANSIVIWGSNVNLIGYGATIYFDNAGGAAGTYGDPITVLGKQNGLTYYSPQVAGSYTSGQVYSGASAASVNVNIEGFKITFGTHSSDTINGVSGLNCEHVTVSNVVVQGVPQTGFAFVATGNFHCLGVTLNNCLVDGSGMQGFRFNSYTPNAGEITAKVINCRTENTALTVASPWAEQYGLPSSAFVRTSGGDLQFQVSFYNCVFDGAVHLLDGYRTTSFKNCRLGFVFALNASAHCALEFDNCRFREFDYATGFGTIDAQIYSRNTYNGQAKLTVRDCTFETPAAAAYTIYNRGFDLDITNGIGSITVYSINWSTYLNVDRIHGCNLTDPGSSQITLGAHSIDLSECRVYTPIAIIQAHRKVIDVRGCRFIVDATFSTYCIEVTYGEVYAVGNIIEYTNDAYATILTAPIANTPLKRNQYLYNAGTEFSYDELYGSAAPADGYWQVSSRVINSAPSAGNPKAWVCTVAGNPGTWVSEGNL